MSKLQFNLNKSHRFSCNLQLSQCSWVSYYPIIFHNAIYTLTKHDYKHWNPIISIMSINQHITSSVQVYLEWTYLFHIVPFLDVLHPSTSSANGTPSTHSSHPTQGRYQPFVYLLCAIKGALSLFFSLDGPSSQHTKCQFKPPNTRTIPCTPLRRISFCALQGASPI